MRVCNLKAAWRQSLHGRINSLLQDLSQLAPHPDRPDHKGPVFLSNHSSYTKPASYDGMLGSIMLENFLGAAFAEVANNNSDTMGGAVAACAFKNADVLELFSEYLEDRGEDKGEGQGTFARVKWQKTRDAFNLSAQDESRAAFEAGLPKRHKIESALAHYTRLLDLPAPAFA